MKPTSQDTAIRHSPITHGCISDTFKATVNNRRDNNARTHAKNTNDYIQPNKIIVKTMTRNVSTMEPAKKEFMYTKQMQSSRAAQWYKQLHAAKSFNDLYNCFKYSQLDKVFTWCQNYRAGLLIYHQDNTCLDILLLKEKAGYEGPPKGQREPQDISAIDTAFRECYEEAGTTLRNCNPRMSFEPIVFVQPRSPGDITVYFIVHVDTKPTINICPNEIQSYRWYNTRENYIDVSMSKTNRNIFNYINSVNKDIVVSSYVSPEQLARHQFKFL